MGKAIRIGTRESQLAIWQADLVKKELQSFGISSELVPISSEGDIDLKTPLYEMGVQGVFTRNLDIALLENRIDIAVHSMKDVPTQLAKGIVQAAVLERASHQDIFVYKSGCSFLQDRESNAIIATSSMRRKAQWLNRYQHHQIENLRGNVNTRLRKIQQNEWQGAIFAAAGLERINLRPSHSVELDWMLPAPAQGAIVVVCRENDPFFLESAALLNHPPSEICTKVERDFLRHLLGGCSTPISSLATVTGDDLCFKGNILSLDGKEKADIDLTVPLSHAHDLGRKAAQQLLMNGGQKIAESIRHAIR